MENTIAKNIVSLALLIALSGLPGFVLSQPALNSGFERIDAFGKPIGWHLPVGARGVRVALDSTMKYKGSYSLRLEQDTSAKSYNTGEVVFTIPSIYQGATIKLIGFIKTEGIDAEGSAGLYIRTEGAAGTVEEDSMRTKKLTGTTPWKKYSVEVSLYDYVKRIAIGGWLKGSTGKMWLDELHVYVEGKELEKTTVYKARLDSGFAQGSGIHLSKPDKKKIRDLQLLGQVWGFLKYHHPAIAGGQLHWDYELFRFLPAYVEATSVKKRNQLLESWINKLGPVSACARCREMPDSVIKMKADLRWMNGSDMSDGLTKQLEAIYKNRNQGSHYYVSSAAGVGNAEFTNEDAYERFVYPDDGFRLLALYRYWNIIRYFFPYRYAIEHDWDAVLVKFIPTFAAAGNKLEYRKAVVELVGNVHDTHANLWGRDSVWANYKGKYLPPFQTKFVDGKLVVTNYYNSVLAREAGILQGDVITAIDGVEPQQLVQDRLRYYPASNYPTQLRDLAKDMLRGNQRFVQVKIQRGRLQLSNTVKRFPIDSLNTQLDKAYVISDTCYKLLPNNIGYINLGSIKSSLLPEIFEKLKSTKGIVIDIRNYPAEFVVFSLSNYLLPVASPFVKFSVANVNNPGMFTWGTTLNTGFSKTDYYRGKVVILVNEITQSQAEYTAMALRVSTNALVVGSTTAGADGNVSIFYLPGRLRTMISGIGVYYPNGRETQRVGIQPDVMVKPSVEGIRAGRDEALERAIQYIQEQR
jgi:C-terminal processing protease CtpA/Prc